MNQNQLILIDPVEASPRWMEAKQSEIACGICCAQEKKGKLYYENNKKNKESKLLKNKRMCSLQNYKQSEDGFLSSALIKKRKMVSPTSR